MGENREKHTTAFSYDAENRPVTMTYDGGDAGQTTTAYDGFGRMSGHTVKAGASGSVYSTSYTYESGDSDDATTPLIKTIEQDGLCFVYGYDDVGNIESVTQCAQLTGDHEPVAPYSTTQYVYDRIGQLIRVNDPQDPTAGCSGTTWVYTYDLGGNILSKDAYAYTTGDVGTAVESHSFTYGNSDWRDQLTAYDGNAITYDAIGNPLDDGTWQYEWQHGRQLKKITKPGETIEFKYNADGLRVEKTATSTGTTKYTLHGKNIVHLTNDSNELHFWYDAQNRPAVVNFNGVKYAYVYNLQGDVMALVDANGDLVVCYVYDAWGKPVNKSGSMAATLGTLNPFRYRGYAYDEESEVYYLCSRFYRHEWNRFVSEDSIISGNVYCYCDNNPCVRTDYDGEDSSLLNSMLKDGGGVSCSIHYDVPLYNQGSFKLCWAFCQVMVEDWKSGTVRSQADAETCAIDIAKRYHQSDTDFNRGGWPENTQPRDSNCIYNPSIVDVYNALKEHGPVYAYYCNPQGPGAHLVVITGCELQSSSVSINNPQGYSGKQQYDDFLVGYYMMDPSRTRELRFIFWENTP